MLGLVKRGGQEEGIGQRGRCRWIQYDHVGDNDGEHVHDNHDSDPSRAGLHSHWVEDQVAEILLEHLLSLSSPSRLITFFPIYTKVVQHYDLSLTLFKTNHCVDFRRRMLGCTSK